MLAGGVAELGTIASVLPFLSMLADPASVASARWPWSALPSLADPVIGTALVFTVFALASGILRFKLAGISQEFSYRLGHDLIVEIQRRILLQPYSFHIARNSSALLSAHEKIEVLIFDVIHPLVQAFVAAFLATVIAAALLYIEPFTALLAAAIFSLIYLLVSVFARKRLTENSNVIARSFDERMKAAQEGLGGIRDVIIDQSHALYLDWFERVDRQLNDARANTAYISIAPRYIIETAGMVLIAAITVALSRRQGGLEAAMPVLGVLALGAQRLLPLFQQIYTGWSLAAGQQAVLNQVIDLLNLPVPSRPRAGRSATPLKLGRSIAFDRVSFTYPSRRKPAIQDVSFMLPRGKSLALVGPTGSGKSTLADLLMGLLEPDEGTISIDGAPLDATNRHRWQRSIAHVPQSIFLADATVEQNIALGMADIPIDRERVADCASVAQLSAFIESLPEGYQTVVGERGIRLSGGQRQRLGIARAVYKQAPVLILDEATSALDESTEAAVIEALHRLGPDGRTLIIIAHRRSTIARCDLVARLHEGRLVEFGTLSGCARSSRLSGAP